MEDRIPSPRLSRLTSCTIHTSKVPHVSSPGSPSASSTVNNGLNLDHHNMDSSVNNYNNENASPIIHFEAGHDLQNTQTTLELKRDAKAATEKEQRMTMMEGIRLYPKACAWSMALSLLIVMEG
jgi:hypothetical protein